MKYFDTGRRLAELEHDIRRIESRYVNDGVRDTADDFYDRYGASISTGAILRAVLDHLHLEPVRRPSEVVLERRRGEKV